MENLAYLLLGGNLGNTIKIFNDAKNAFNKNNLAIKISSGIYKSSAWGRTDQPDFLNQAVIIKTTLNAPQLLALIQKIEKHSGRQRIVKYGARTLDIDILYFNEEIINIKNLTVPHPQIQFRKFTLIPLVEIAPAYLHPVLKLTNLELLEKCEDKGEVILL